MTQLLTSSEDMCSLQPSWEKRACTGVTVTICVYAELHQAQTLAGFSIQHISEEYGLTFVSLITPYKALYMLICKSRPVRYKEQAPLFPF